MKESIINYDERTVKDLHSISEQADNVINLSDYLHRFQIPDVFVI